MSLLQDKRGLSRVYLVSVETEVRLESVDELGVGVGDGLEFADVVDFPVFGHVVGDGFGQVGVDVGVGDQLLVRAAVDVDATDGGGADGEVLLAEGEVDVLEDVDLAQLRQRVEAAESVAVLHDLAGAFAAEGGHAGDVARVAAVEIDLDDGVTLLSGQGLERVVALGLAVAGAVAPVLWVVGVPSAVVRVGAVAGVETAGVGGVAGGLHRVGGGLLRRIELLHLLPEIFHVHDGFPMLVVQKIEGEGGGDESEERRRSEKLSPRGAEKSFHSIFEFNELVSYFFLKKTFRAFFYAVDKDTTF